MNRSISSWRRLCAVCVLAVSLAIPGCGSAISREQEASMGTEAAPQFLKEGGGVIPDAQVRQYVDSVGRKMLAQETDPEVKALPWEFFTLDSAEINAFALPGGKVFISRALLERMDNEAQMAGVLGHEIGHVVAQHIGKQMSQQQGFGIIAAGVGIATESDVVRTGAELLGKGMLLKFSRSQELEADRYGMEYMHRAGYKPGQMRKVMEILKEAGGGGGMEMLSTHPSPDSRLEQAGQLLAEKYPDSRNNPSFGVGEEAFRANVLNRLSQLPPPPDAK